MWQEEQQQTVIHIPLRQLKAFPNHPFQVREDAEFEELCKKYCDPRRHPSGSGSSGRRRLL